MAGAEGLHEAFIFKAKRCLTLVKMPISPQTGDANLSNLNREYWDHLFGDAGDVIDWACDHLCEGANVRWFLDDWRSAGADGGEFANRWPLYMAWLKVQQDGAKAQRPKGAIMTDSPTATEGPVETDALTFEITGPDADDFVWLVTKGGNEALNLGRSADVIEKLSQWLGSIDADESGVVHIKRMN